MRLRRVTVFGSSQAHPGSNEYETARAIGWSVGRYGLELVNGGYTGTMEASAKGAREAGGRVIGVTVRTFTYALPNPHLTREIRAANLFARLARLIALGDLYVVLPGSTGTLVELSLVWEFLNKGDSAKPIFADAAWQAIGKLLPPESERGRYVRSDDTGTPWRMNRLLFCEDLPGTLERFLADWRAASSSSTDG